MEGSLDSHDRWKANLVAFEAFVREHGHARVPSSYTTADGRPLGAWISEQCVPRGRFRSLASAGSDAAATTSRPGAIDTPSHAAAEAADVVVAAPNAALDGLAEAA